MPEFMHFGENLELGVPAMDEEHRDLVDLINQLACAAGVLPCWPAAVETTTPKVQRQRALGVLQQIEYATHDHFLSEEALMQSTAYPDFESHRTEHRMLLAELRNCIQSIHCETEPLDRETLMELKLWLLGHILGSDKEFAQFYQIAREKGVAEFTGPHPLPSAI